MADRPALAQPGLKDPPLRAGVSATEQILREAGIDERVAAALQEIALPVPEDLRAVVDHALAGEPVASWRAAITRVAEQLLEAQALQWAPREHRT